MLSDFQGLIRDASDEDVRLWLASEPKHLLYAELYIAELCARKGGKRKTYDTHAFEVNLFENLARLADAIWNFEYEPSRGTAHIIERPVKREIFAAPYVDRVVHHWVIDNIVDYWENRLDYDAYSCRIKKGTSFGIKRLKHHIDSVAQKTGEPVHVAKLDISGYFMHIQRDLLYKKIIAGLD